MSDVGKVVNVNCRAPIGLEGSGGKGCGGQKATILMKIKLPAGGTCIRYACVSCNKPFSITF